VSFLVIWKIDEAQRFFIASRRYLRQDEKLCRDSQLFIKRGNFEIKFSALDPKL
jgi:hypothetical protein